MDTKKRLVYLKLTPKALHNRLVRRNAPALVVQETKARIAEQKHFARVQRSHNFQHKRLWGDVLRPLAHEINNVRTMLRRQPVSGRTVLPDAYYEQRRVSLNAYLECIERLHGRLVLASRGLGTERPATPAVLARLVNNERLAKNPDAELIPNSGSHWTDWVKPATRVQVALLFDAIPRPNKTERIKRPFARTVSSAQHRAQADLLLKAMNKALDNAIRGDDRERQRQITQAKRILAACKPTSALPWTWFGLLPKTMGEVSPPNLGE
jgi:hypothetical protein